MNKQSQSRDHNASWPIIDGPWKGVLIACAHDDFEVLLNPLVPRTARLEDSRVRYYLRQLDDGGYAWSCANET